MSAIRKSIFVFLILAIAGLSAYFLVLPGEHPDRQAEVEMDQQEIRDHSRQILTKFGYDTSQLQLRTDFRAAREDIKQHVYSYGRSDLIDKIKNRENLLPPFYFWQHNWHDIDTDITGEASFSITISAGTQTQVDADTGLEAKFTPGGDLTLLDASDLPLPTGFNPQILPEVFRHAPGIQSFLDDREPEVTEVYYDPSRRVDTRIEENALILNTRDLQKTGNQLLKDSYWAEFNLETDTITVAEFDGNAFGRLADIHYRTTEPVNGYDYEVTLKVTPGGYAAFLDYDYSLEEAHDKAYSQLPEIYFLAGTIATIVLVLIVFFARLNNQMIGIRIVLADAVIFGLLLLLSIGSSIIVENFMSDFGPQMATAILGILLVCIAAAAAFIPFAATTESLSHDTRPEKMYTLTLLRNGFIFNKQIGYSFLNGVSVGFAFLILSAGILLVDNHTLFDVDSGMVTDLLRYQVIAGINTISEAMVNSIYYTFFIIAPLAFFVSSRLPKRGYAAAIVLIISVIVSGWAPISSNGLLDVAYQLAGAGIITFVIFRFDVLTLLTGLISTFLLINSQLPAFAPVGNFPAAVLIWVVPLGLVIIAFIGLNRELDEEEAPDVKPDYIKKLAEEERIRQSHRLAREVHQSFLPQKLPEHEHLDIAGRCTPAFDVGGDYYDFFQLPDNRLGVVIGDVSGKGVHAAFYMTLMKGYLQSLSYDSLSPAEQVSKIHRLFLQNSRFGTFITMIYGVIDPEKDSFTFVRAGHNPLLHFQSSTEKPAVHKPGGLAIGLGTPEQFDQNLEEQTIPFSSGVVLVFYTDGYVEATNPRNRQLGEAAFYSILSEYRHLSAIEIVNRTGQRIRQFTRKHEPDDDMTMTVIRRR